jgi:WYL domain
MTVTPIRPLPPAWAPLERALRERRTVQVSYHGRRRLVCPHALGWHNQRPLLLGYQVGGQTSSGTLPADPRKRWRCMFIDQIDDVVITATTTRWQTADNYNCSRPFNTIDHVVVAVGRSDLPQGTEP